MVAVTYLMWPTSLPVSQVTTSEGQWPGAATLLFPAAHSELAGLPPPRDTGSPLLQVYSLCKAAAF